MNDFGWFLEIELRQMSDPVVNSLAPRRRWRKQRGSPILAVISAPLEKAAEVLPAVEPMALPVQPFRVLH
ncbi:MAG: hypothetical protein M3Q90_04505 [Candidatus Dormibacteraeota bacterium]|nr:hypothetical protein [Candidatus Dormibacteraeota bacterium]